jgi:shikimate dehydrogenase
MPGPFPKDRILLAGVIGWPVHQSRSPMLHGHWFKEHGLNGYYMPLPIKPDDLETALRGLPALGFSGVNVTIPHKQTSMPLMAEIDAVGRGIGAINLIVVRPDGSMTGSNTDAYGCITNIRQTQPDWRADTGPMVVIGAGGASRTAIWAFADAGVNEIRIVNRTHERALQVAKDLGGPCKVYRWEERHDILDGAALLVNATNQGMIGQQPLDLRLDKLPRHAIVYDIVYNPIETPLLAAARLRGHPVIPGLGMLLNQAPPAWKAWFGIEPKVTPELRKMIEATL